nr:MAG TPA: hypothetical protein [Caudoviricetes sp.]
MQKRINNNNRAKSQIIRSKRFSYLALFLLRKECKEEHIQGLKFYLAAVRTCAFLFPTAEGAVNKIF